MLRYAAPGFARRRGREPRLPRGGGPPVEGGGARGPGVSTAALPLVCPRCRAAVAAGPEGAACDGVRRLLPGARRRAAPGGRARGRGRLRPALLPDPRRGREGALLVREPPRGGARRAARRRPRPRAPGALRPRLRDRRAAAVPRGQRDRRWPGPATRTPRAWRSCAASSRRRSCSSTRGASRPSAPATRLLSLFDVLEHIDDDTGTLRHIFSVLEPGGVLVLTVPAHPFLFDEMDELAHHRRRYRRSELGDKLRRAGFEVRRLTHFMAPLVPLVAVRWLVRAVSRGRRSAERRRMELRVVAGAQRPDARRAGARAAPGARGPAAVRLLADRGRGASPVTGRGGVRSAR